MLNCFALSPSVYKNFITMVFWILSGSGENHRVMAANWLKRGMALSSASASPQGQCQDPAMALEDIGHESTRST